MLRSLPLLPLVAALLLFACSTPAPKTSSADEKFEALAKGFIEQFLAQQPEDATMLGDHRYDTRLNDMSASGIASAVALRRATLDSLAQIKVEDLSPENRVDFDILQHNLHADLFALDTLRAWKSNPLIYNPGNAVFSLVARDFAPLTERMKSVEARLAAIPAYLAAARENLEAPPALHTETAIRQNDGTIGLLTGTLAPFIDSLPEAQRATVAAARDTAVAALQAYGQWLRTDLLPRSTGDYRLGEALYRAKLRYAIVTDMTPEQILARAEADLEKTTRDLAITAAELHRHLFPNIPLPDESEKGRAQLIRRVLDRLAEKRPTNETVVDDARRTLEEATAFVREHNLVTIPSDPLEIIVMPEFQRGVAVAYCDSPGPLEKNGRTFYAIAPTPADWSSERTESFYREYNAYMLKNLTVHEAMPGHYLQLMTGNRFQARTLIRGIFPSGIFAEGWATYVEAMMVEAGFGGAEVRMQQLKMRLRLIINAMLDQGVHMRGMTEREGMKLMMERGFQEEGEAAGKWKRACLTSAQLSTYYIGNMLMTDLRARAEAAGDFNLGEFHDKVISYGTISPTYLPMLLKLPAGGSGSQTSNQY